MAKIKEAFDPNDATLVKNAISYEFLRVNKCD